LAVDLVKGTRSIVMKESGQKEAWGGTRSQATLGIGKEQPAYKSPVAQKTRKTGNFHFNCGSRGVSAHRRMGHST